MAFITKSLDFSPGQEQILKR
jgi:hypothetical protein